MVYRMESIVRLFNDVQGHTYDTILDLVFTTKRLIVLRILSPQDGRDLRAAPNLLSLFIGSSGLRRAEAVKRYKIASERRQKLMYLTPEQIANEDECILEIQYNLLSKAKFTQSIFGRVVEFSFERDGVKHSLSVRLTREQYEDMWRLLGEVAPQIREKKVRS